MKKKFLILPVIIFAGAILISLILTQLAWANGFTGQLQSPIKHETFGELIEAVIEFIFKIALILAPLFIIIAGFYFVAAAGDTKHIETGKRILLYTLIGFLIILISSGLIELIKEVFQVVD